MKRENFIKCAERLREYAAWDRKLYACDIDLSSAPINDIVEALQMAMCDFDANWAYDEKTGLDWIAEWSFGEPPYFCQTRHGVEFDLHDAGALYDFLVFMNEHGWED